MLNDWDNIRFFLAVAETGSLSAAAKQVGSTQPTVGRHISILEERTGLRLFDRGREGLRLTRQGLALLDTARKMKDAAEAFSLQGDALDETASGTIRISSNAQLGQFLFHHLRDLKDHLPSIQIELVTSQLDPNLSRREADINLRFCLPDAGNLIARKMGAMDFAVYATAAFVDRHPEALDERRFSLPHWVVFDEKNQLETGNSWLTKKLSATPHYRTDTVQNQRTAILSGAGMGVMPAFSAIADPRLVEVGKIDNGLRSTIHMIIHQDLRHTPLVKASSNALVRIFNQFGKDLLVP
ncbi:LysR family transcriptional regulator [Aestuariispira insulae]|uniref:DNA-binding transcriptional LysR family regulator n=1 Tax=Aestuariispira insulae TaxID=1461337 RepID=A0A3D9HV90_9PROT|nr:LysR family transcriptional regulator [Aestuariispira insulae]RED53377.1 DNA-binding transcriptional LysR family regulator [Aestuariispira insulae]